MHFCVELMLLAFVRAAGTPNGNARKMLYPEKLRSMAAHLLPFAALSRPHAAAAAYDPWLCVAGTGWPTPIKLTLIMFVMLLRHNLLLFDGGNANTYLDLVNWQPLRLGQARFDPSSAREEKHQRCWIKDEFDCRRGGH